MVQGRTVVVASSVGMVQGRTVVGAAEASQYRDETPRFCYGTTLFLIELLCVTRLPRFCYSFLNIY
jgi:hypothetical protein